MSDQPSADAIAAAVIRQQQEATHKAQETQTRREQLQVDLRTAFPAHHTQLQIADDGSHAALDLANVGTVHVLRLPHGWQLRPMRGVGGNHFASNDDQLAAALERMRPAPPRPAAPGAQPGQGQPAQQLTKPKPRYSFQKDNDVPW